jgi:IS30 family transposase
VHQWWPPQEILHRLRREFADDPMMQVSHETSYQALFVQGRGAANRAGSWRAACATDGSSARAVTAPPSPAGSGTWS